MDCSNCLCLGQNPNGSNAKHVHFENDMWKVKLSGQPEGTEASEATSFAVLVAVLSIPLFRHFVGSTSRQEVDTGVGLDLWWTTPDLSRACSSNTMPNMSYSSSSISQSSSRNRSNPGLRLGTT